MRPDYYASMISEKYAIDDERDPAEHQQQPWQPMLPVNDSSRRLLPALPGLLISLMPVAFVQFPGFRLLLFLVLVDAR